MRKLFRLIKSVIWLALVVGVLFVVVGYTLPGTIEVERQVVIKAPPEKVFAVIGHLRRFNEWSPWADMDANAKFSFDGPETGTGQKMSWTSQNADLGSGAFSIVETAENQKVVGEFDYGAKGKATATMSLAAVDGGTGVTWGYWAPRPSLMARWSGIFHESRVGADYEKGLAKLRGLVEKEAGGG